MPKPPTPAPEPVRHPIAVVAQRTGLSQDVLRVWERRYGAVHPVRSDTGERFYTDEDIHRLRLLDAATRAGRRIGRVARLPTAELEQLVADDVTLHDRLETVAAPPRDSGDPVGDAIALARRHDAAGLDGRLRRAVALVGVPAFLEHVAVPVLRQVGDEWHAGRLTTAQEHLVSAVVHDIVADVMRGVAERNGAPRVVIATPAGERHAIGAALAGASAAVEGWNVLYLGADLPAKEIAHAAVSAGARLVALSVVYVDDRRRVAAELRELRSALPADVALVVGGGGAAALAAELHAAGIIVTSSLAEFSAEMRRMLGASQWRAP